MIQKKPLLIGCGILEKEIIYLCRKNRWQIDLKFLDSALHCHLKNLGLQLEKALTSNRERNTLVCYGACHPLMDKILEKAGAHRIQAQNCVELLVSREIFMEELLTGAFFLLEEWVERWDVILNATYSRCRPEVKKEIFRSDRNRFIAVRTPCSGNFADRASEIAKEMDVPLTWIDVGLEHLEMKLKALF